MSRTPTRAGGRDGSPPRAEGLSRSHMKMKRCPGPCGRELELNADNFYADVSRPSGFRPYCRDCAKKSEKERRDRRVRERTRGPESDLERPPATAAPERWPNVSAFDEEIEADDERDECDEREARERAARRASDFEAMKPVDFADEFATSVANSDSAVDQAIKSQAAKEKRQEFNRRMGEFATDLRDSAVAAAQGGEPISDLLPAKHAGYIQLLAEQERRFGNRRWARSISIAEAHEQLSREAMIHVAEKYFSAKVEPNGYAALPRPDKPASRTACVLLSDLHLGSELDSLDEPVTFKAVEEARRLEFVLRQFIEFKPQYRENTEALIIINGDIIEGDLLHDRRSGAPLTEQKAIFWTYFRAFIGHVAAAYRSVRVVCQPGNHGRDKLRHPGRATAAKWDGVEWGCYFALKMMCSELRNVRWDLPFRAISIVDLHGQKLGVTHADTEVKVGDPDTKAKENGAYLAKINSTNFYGVHFDGWAFGHYHKGRLQPGEPSVVWNGPLVPPNGHARTSGYIGELCGQWIWESVPGHLFGDARFIRVGLDQDRDERLGTLIKPFRFSMFADD